jgi:predicted membrane metal-binding protein
VFFSLFLKYFPIWVRLLGITIFIVIFVLLVGFSIPVIRAAIMGLLAYYILLS